MFLMMRYLGNNYTGAYREVNKVVINLWKLKMDNTLIEKYVRVTLTGHPNHSVAQMSCANTLLYWHPCNGPTIDKKIHQVHATIKTLSSPFLTG
jgi:hypothetical protein